MRKKRAILIGIPLLIIAFAVILLYQNLRTWVGLPFQHPDLPDEPALVYAARTDSYVQVRWLCWLGQDVNSFWAIYNYTALSEAAYNGNVKVVEFLRDHHADPNLGSPLLRAVLKDNANVVGLLLTMGADPTIVSQHHNDRESSLRAACRLGNRNIVEMLLRTVSLPRKDYESEEYAIMAAAVSSDHPEILAMLVARGARLQLRRWDGVTLLHDAVGRPGPYPDTLRFLLKKGLDVNAVDQNGRTPLHEFAGTTTGNLKATEQALQLLLDSGANANARDKDGRTALHEAVLASQRTLVVERLLAAGADPAVRDLSGKTPLDYARVLGTSGEAILEVLSKGSKGSRGR